VGGTVACAVLWGLTHVPQELILTCQRGYCTATTPGERPVPCGLAQSFVGWFRPWGDLRDEAVCDVAGNVGEMMPARREGRPSP
jgi:hypothetical protein